MRHKRHVLRSLKVKEKGISEQCRDFVWFQWIQKPCGGCAIRGGASVEGEPGDEGERNGQIQSSERDNTGGMVSFGNE